METRLIDVLQPIKDNDYQLPENQSLQELTTMMLQKIGSVHPILRDDLIHTIFTTFIERGHYSHEQLKNILHSILNKNYLFYRIGTSKKQEDAVFKRSFSVLLIPPIMEKHRKTPFLKEAEVHRVWDHLKRYMQQESDHRGMLKGRAGPMQWLTQPMLFIMWLPVMKLQKRKYERCCRLLKRSF